MRSVRCLALAAFSLVVASSSQAVSEAFVKAQLQCTRAQLAETRKLVSCVYAEQDKALRKGLPSLDLSKCLAKFYDRWAKAESRADARFGPGTCPSVIDALGAEGLVADFRLRSAGAIQGIRFIDLGFAVGDTQTGLMWIKTDDAGGVTDYDNTYSWSTSGSATVSDAPRNGTAFTSYLDQLNSCTTSTTGYGNYCDWRIPQPGELATIVDCSAGPSCIDESVFGPTKATFYWTNSPTSGDQRFIRSVDFSDGSQPTLSGAAGTSVRAVRHWVGFLF